MDESILIDSGVEGDQIRSKIFNEPTGVGSRRYTLSAITPDGLVPTSFVEGFFDNSEEEFQIVIYRSTNGIIGWELFDTYTSEYLLKRTRINNNQMHTTFSPLYLIVTRRPHSLISALIQIGGLLAIFKVISVILVFFH